jgi:hypothetical protein
LLGELGQPIRSMGPINSRLKMRSLKMKVIAPSDEFLEESHLHTGLEDQNLIHYGFADRDLKVRFGISATNFG